MLKFFHSCIVSHCTVGSHLEVLAMDNVQYRNILNSLEAVRKQVGNDALELRFPQIVVIGDQSSGKSSLLSQITGIPFPVKSGITTKCPIVVHTKYNNKLESSKYTFDDGEHIVEIAHDDFEDKLLSLQRESLGGCKVIASPIVINAESSTLNDLVLVDLPGIIANGEGKEDVIDMITKYIAPEQSLILVVTEAKQDDETAQALELAKQFDYEEQRTMRILTKYDMFDSDESTIRANNLVCLNTELSAHAIICRPNGKQYDHKLETDELKKHDLPPERADINSLKERLPQLLCNLIQTNLPEVKEQVRNMRSKYNKLLAAIGNEAPDNTRLLLQVQQYLLKKASDLEIFASKPMAIFRGAVHETQNGITKVWVDQQYHHNAFECVFFQGNDTFNKCLEAIVGWWQPILDTLQESIDDIIRDIVDAESIPGVPQSLRMCIKNKWAEAKCDLMIKLCTQFERESAKETKYKTMNHYLTSKYSENLVLPEPVVDKIVASIDKSTFVSVVAGAKTIIDISETRSAIKELIIGTLQDNLDEFNRQPIDEQHKRRVLAAVKANWAVSHKNFIDNILSAVQNIIIKGVHEWLSEKILGDEDIANFAKEDPEISRNRKLYSERITNMNKCNDILSMC